MPLIMVYWAFYLEEIMYFSSVIEYGVPQYLYYQENPLWGLCYLGYPMALLFFPVIWYFFKHDNKEVDRVLIVWLVCFIPLFIKYPHRGLTYLSQPLAMMGAVAIENKIVPKEKVLLVL